MGRQAPQVAIYDRLDGGKGNIDPTQLRSMTMVRAVNGEHSLTISTSQELSKHDRLLWRDTTGRWHEYVIQGIEGTHNESGRAVFTYYAVWSIQHDLEQTFVNDQYGCGVVPGHASVPHPAVDGMTCALAGTTRWEIGTVDVGTQASASFYRRSGWEGLQTVVEKWGGEVDAEIEVNNVRVINRAVALRAHLGSADAVRRFDYSADLRTIKRTIHDVPWTCRIIPLGKAMETEAGGYTRRPTIESVNNDVMWLEDASAVEACRVYNYGRNGWEYPVQIVLNDTYEEPADLKAWALEHITDYTRPKVSYEATVVQLAQAGLDPQGVGLGDAVIIVDRDFDAEGLAIEGRVLKIKEDLLDPAKTELTIGNFTESMASTLAGINRQLGNIAERVETSDQIRSSGSYVSDLIARLNEQANATGGYTYMTEGNGFRTYDVAVTDPSVGAEASAVVEVKGGTLRIANTKDSQGQWQWRTVFTSGHVAAELVTAAALTAGTITSANGDVAIDLDNNTISVGGKALSTVIQDVDGLNTLIRDTADGTLVCQESGDFAALMDASGAFEVVRVTWQDGEPTIVASWFTIDSTGASYTNRGVSGHPFFLTDGYNLQVGYQMGNRLRYDNAYGLQLINRSGNNDVVNYGIEDDGSPYGEYAYRWRQIATTTGTTAKSISLYRTVSGVGANVEYKYSELMVTCTHTSGTVRNYAGSVVIPVAQVTTAETEWYLGGGVTGTSVSSGRSAVFKLTSTLFTPVQVMINGSTYSCTWTVYAR